jgi:hypothetical protein
MDVLGGLNNYIEKVEKIRADYARRKDEIEKNEKLSIYGRRKTLEEEKEKSEARYKEVMGEYKAWREDLQETIVRRAYSHPHSVMAHTSIGADEMRPLITEIEEAYREGRSKELLGRVIGSHDAKMARAYVGTAYARRDFDAIEKLEKTDKVAKEIFDYESLFGSLASAEMKMKIKLELRGI